MSITIKPVRFTENGFMTEPFALGGEGEALADLGYKPEQVSKILITHKHADHTGELRAFPNAEIICSAAEAETDVIKPFKPTVATFLDGLAFEDLPADWHCLRCKQPKEKFNKA